ncbi:MAG: alpha/beta fold hydrolase, partial [Myxococcota bacterium]
MADEEDRHVRGPYGAGAVRSSTTVRRCAGRRLGVRSAPMPTLTINGADLVYEDVGHGSRAFVLVHGFTGFRDDFRERLPALAALGRTIIYDHRGHGESANTGDAASYTFAQLVDDLGTLLDALDIARCDLLGHSMGGMLALRFALARPQRVASLVLMDTAARTPDHMPRAPMAAAG